MKKVLALLGLAAFSLGYAQGGTLIINNYSKFDFSGFLIANNALGNCYPYVTSENPDMVSIPADSHMGNGKALVYKDYQSQYNTSMYPMTRWSVSTSSTSTTSQLWSSMLIAPGGVISNNTRWSATKFVMYYPGTTNLAPDGFSGPIALPNSCYNAPSNFTTASGNSAEIFTITSGTTTTTYIQLF